MKWRETCNQGTVCWRISGQRNEELYHGGRRAVESAIAMKRLRASRHFRGRTSCAVGQKLGVDHQIVQRRVERAVADGPLATLEDRPRPGNEPTNTPEAKAWLVSLACDSANDHRYPHESWTTRLLARHAREHKPAAGHACLASLIQKVCKSLGQDEVKPHKVGYYLENRDAGVRTEDAGGPVRLS
ncbi:helix-turn-helix domain-containing protein [Bradyrhizobium yuanmingense]|uniref:helix-turn-helix domain-containing protein n=1 Tax=Bradyrhizobium yuanmingense TaxID=108015 RepID=UPI0023B9FE48|nr:helix-turn-helix domain-containing protein [Bradyrhizobium yuanmingense]MDF0582013.1 helix-turn-helix domain-containing protein [Bradyrhizobium yuanmingense]